MGCDNKMGKGLIPILVIFLVILILLWVNRFKYEEGEFIGKKTTVRINRITGKAQYLFNGIWISYPSSKQAVSNNRNKELPYEELRYIEGKALFAPFGKFVVDLYNGSIWEVKKVIIRIIAKSTGGDVIWDRDFLESVSYLPPLHHTRITIFTGEEIPPKFDWTIAKAWGSEYWDEKVKDAIIKKREDIIESYLRFLRDEFKAESAGKTDEEHQKKKP